MKLHQIFISLTLIALTGCGGSPVTSTTPTVEYLPTATSTLVPTVALTPTPTGPLTLRIWLPPEFDPAANTRAGDILQTRLDEFMQRRSDVQIEVRVKALEGPGGLLDSLTTASAAAPLTLPDIIALPRPTLEAAALKGLLHPYDDLTDIMDDSDWYDYAQTLARLQESTFGLPFSGDALIMAYRSTEISEPPSNLSSALETKGPLVFPAADPQALFTLALYQSANGTVLDDQGHPRLELDPLEEVLSFYQEAATIKLTPPGIIQFDTDEQSWQAFTENQSEMVITWSSRYLNNLLADTTASPIPTTSGSSYTIATGWVWALASSEPEHLKLSVELTEYLSDSAFLAEWTSALGYLPPRPSAMASWKSSSTRTLFKRISLSASLHPPTDVLNSISPSLSDATTEVLKLSIDAMDAAQLAIESLSNQ